MTFRLLVLAVCLGGCSGSAKRESGSAALPSGNPPGAPVASDSANGAVAPSASTANAGSTATASSTASAGAVFKPGQLPANHNGKIPVLEYHIVGSPKNTLYTRTLESFKADMADVYRRGYRPITIAQMLDKNFNDVPAGMSPVVFVFDDASPEQFSYIEGANGALTIDPGTAVGVWEDFIKQHSDWKNRATFCMLNGASAGHNFFGDSPKYHNQKKAWRFQKVKWLADQGFELCDHTVWHARLDKFSDAVVQEQIARNAMAIDSAVPGYKVRTMALPYGIWPKNRPLAWQGSWTDPKTHETHTYHFDAVLEVSGGPTASPFDPAFNPHSIKRIEAIGSDIEKTLDKLDRDKTRFVK